jgi:hypothetical protein
VIPEQPPKQDWASPNHLVIDQTPDERGNVTVAATFVGGRMIALGFNAN